MSLAEDIRMTREAVFRQPACPIPDCDACRSNRERTAAAERVIAMAERAARLQDIYDAWVSDGRPK